MCRDLCILSTTLLLMSCGGVSAQETETASEKPAIAEAVTPKSDDHAQSEHATESAGHPDESVHADTDHSDPAHQQGHAEGSHAEGGHDVHHAPITPYNDLPLWGLVAFIGFVWAFKKLGLWDSLLLNMKEREEITKNEISSAENHLTSARSMLSNYKGQLEAMDETIKATLAEAGRDAEHTHQEILDVAAKEAAAASERALHEINRVRDQSLLEIFSSMADKVAQATEATVRQKLSNDDQDRLIDETLNQLTHS